MWTQPFQSVLLHLLIQANAFHFVFLPGQVLASPVGWSAQVNATQAKPHRIQVRQSGTPDKLVMPVDLSILRTVPEIHDPLQPRPVLLAVDLAALNHGRSDHHSPEPRARNRGDTVSNDIVLIPDLTLPARIKNDYAPSHRLTARVAAVGNDRIPVFEHLHSSYGQGQTKDALWDFLEDQMDEDNHLVPGPSEYDYPEDYVTEEDDDYWYNQDRFDEDEYNKITPPHRQYRDKKNDPSSRSWRAGGQVTNLQRSRDLAEDRGQGQGYKSSTVQTVTGFNKWRPGRKKPTTGKTSMRNLVSRWSWSRGGKKNIFFTAGWGPGGKASQSPRKAGAQQQASSSEEKEESRSSLKQPPWRRPGPMWGVPHLLGPYW